MPRGAPAPRLAHPIALLPLKYAAPSLERPRAAVAISVAGVARALRSQALLRRRCTSSNEIAAGVTPAMRDA